VIEETGGKKSDEDFEELLEVVVARQTINNARKKQRHKNEHRPFRNTELGEEEGHVQNENQVSQVKLKGHLEKHVGERVQAGEDEKYGKLPEHG
jgi:hypothetical protein